MTILQFEDWSYLNEAINEMNIPSGKWIDVDLKRISNDGMKQIWDMYTSTYSKEGLDFSAEDYIELQNKYQATFLKDVDDDTIPDAFIIYKKTDWGNKIALLGTNDKKEAKKELIKHLIKLVNTRGWFIEASAKMETLLSTSRVPVVTDEDVIQKIVGVKKAVEMQKDGYYTRFLSKANKRITKRIYGKLK